MTDTERVLAGMKRGAEASPERENENAASVGGQRAIIRRRRIDVVEPPAEFRAMPSAVAEAAFVRDRNGLLLLAATSPANEERIYVEATMLAERGYSGFRRLACGTNGCVYSVYSRTLRKRVALKVGNVSAQEERTHRDAMSKGVAPNLLDSFVVVAGTLDQQRFVRFDEDVSQRALVMPLLTPLNSYVTKYGITPSFVAAWEALVRKKFDAAIFHSDWHWGNTIVRVDTTSAERPPPVLEMLLIDWDPFLSVYNLPEETLYAVIYQDMLYQYSQYATATDETLAEHKQLALDNGMLHYLLYESERAEPEPKARMRFVLRTLIVRTVNQCALAEKQTYVIDSAELLAYANSQFLSKPIVMDAVSGKFV